MAASDPTEPYRIRRQPGGFRDRVRRAWGRWWVKALAVLGAVGAIGYAIVFFLFAVDLPSVETLRTYEPPLPTNVRGADGTPIHSYARERRVELSFDEYPPLLVRAFLAAEDKTFFQHHGVDYLGIVSAAINNFRSGRRPVGASTITQQVAKNLLIGNAPSYSRKIKEAILAYRIEDTLTKKQILELYLNQIALGRNAFGVEAASYAYFGKDLKDLDLAQMAYLAILPKGPSNYDPVRHPDRALERRGYVLREMLKNGFITKAQHDQAMAEPLGTIPRQTPKLETAGSGYFVEEVRRQLIAKFGQDQRDGPYSIYAGGLWVRTSLDNRLQDYAQTALREGLLRFDQGRGWSGPLKHVEIKGDAWQAALLDTNIGLDHGNWRAGIITALNPFAATLGFADGSVGLLPRDAAQMPVRGEGGSAFAKFAVGDIIAVAPEGSGYALRSVPRISGAFVVEEPQTGRVLAMQGGFDFRAQQFNRATQAKRQPGSTIKPIVYAAALEGGMTPASIIVDEPFCVDQGARLGMKCFRNFNNVGGSGAHTMRWGVEQSRNLMTVRAATTTGMPRIVSLMDRIGVGKYEPYLSYALGAGETTVSRMVNAYAILANQGRSHPATLIDFVQDRHGKVILPENWQACDRCNAPDWNGKAMPRPVSRGKQIVDAMSAYQMIHIAEGVIQRGTATVLRDLDRPMFGKTGTNSGPTDVWFIGGTPQLIGGLYIGYDQPRPLGGWAQGGTVAAPIFKAFAQKAYDGMDKLPFRAPAGIRMVRIDRITGKPVFGAWPSDDPKAPVIWEAFKPESEPRRVRRRNLIMPDPAAAAEKARAEAAAQEARRDSDFLQREGGIY